MFHPQAPILIAFHRNAIRRNAANAPFQHVANVILGARGVALARRHAVEVRFKLGREALFKRRARPIAPLLRQRIVKVQNGFVEIVQWCVHHHLGPQEVGVCVIAHSLRVGVPILCYEGVMDEKARKPPSRLVVAIATEQGEGVCHVHATGNNVWVASRRVGSKPAPIDELEGVRAQQRRQGVYNLEDDGALPEVRIRVAPITRWQHLPPA